VANLPVSSRICRPHCQASFRWRFTALGSAGIDGFGIYRKDVALTDEEWLEAKIYLNMNP
jgi:hypothetical protein